MGVTLITVYVHTRRQELVDELLAQKLTTLVTPYERAIGYGLDVTNGFQRWLPRQQELYRTKYVVIIL